MCKPPMGRPEHRQVIGGILFRHIDDIEREKRHFQEIRRKRRIKIAARVRSMEAYTATQAGQLAVDEIERRMRLLKIERRKLNLERRALYLAKRRQDPAFNRSRYKKVCGAIARIDRKRKAWDRALDRLAARAFS